MMLELDAIKHVLLHEWDPIGVASFSDAHDEYDAYATEVLGMIRAGATPTAVAEYLTSVVTLRMEMDGDPKLDREIAHKAVLICRP